MNSVTGPMTCTRCSAVVRPDDVRCPICYAHLADGFDPLTAPIEDVLRQGGGTATLTQYVQPVADPALDHPPAVVARPTEPTLEIAASVEQPSVEQPSVELSDVDVMLAMLAAEHRHGDSSAQIVDRLGDKNARIVIMIGGTVVISILCFVVLSLLGSLS